MLQSGQTVTASEYTQLFTQGVTTVTTTTPIVLDLHGLSQFTIITDATGVATVSRVDSPSASAHNTGINQFTVAANTLQATPVDWPYVYITVSVGTARVAVI